jgi:hypothetical protein
VCEHFPVEFRFEQFYVCVSLYIYNLGLGREISMQDQWYHSPIAVVNGSVHGCLRK